MVLPKSIIANSPSIERQPDRRPAMDAMPIRPLSGSTSTSSLVGDQVWQMSDYSIINCDSFRTPSVDDTALLMCHESSPIDEVVVCTTSESYPSSSTAAVDAECDSSVPISLAAALLEASSLVRRSFVHRVMLNDRRVLKAMLSMDDQCLPSAHYFKYTQPDLLPFMRRMVVTWMLEVSNFDVKINRKQLRMILFDKIA